MTIYTYGPNGERITLTGAVEFTGAAPPKVVPESLDSDPIDTLGGSVVCSVTAPKQEVFTPGVPSE